MTLNQFLTGIADAITAKKGTAASIPASSFASQISSISTNGSVIYDKGVLTLSGGIGSRKNSITFPKLKNISCVSAYGVYVNSYNTNALCGGTCINGTQQNLTSNSSFTVSGNTVSYSTVAYSTSAITMYVTVAGEAA